MPGTLVIVESPAKAKTIEKYLGGDYAVRASFGHVRDLPKSQLGVDVEDGFEPVYEVPEDSKRHVADLKRALKGADELVLATDYDREGEAIAYHVATLLGVAPDQAKRITFTEITRDAILESVRHPRAIDLKLVDAQEARRVLDRLVGYRISPILWRKVRPGLSAGRVQSVAVRLIVEREREIRAFVPVEYWSVDVRLTPEGEEQPFVARLTEIPEGKLATAPDKKGILLGAETDAMPHVERLGRASYRVVDVQRKERKRSPAPPFTTSTLQQEAARKLGFSARKTMTLAQRLYEGISLPGEGSVGLITYMRTDSVTIADAALREIAELVKQEYGPSYALAEHRRYKTRSRNAQEAHEAVRPTSVLRSPDRVAASLDRDQLRLYDLIWKRTMATQMAEARFAQVGVDIRAVDGDADYGLRATGQTLVFDGFIRVYTEGRDEGPDEDAESRLPELSAEQVLRMLELLPEQHFTQPPPRYTEASLVKTLEELGIGRPSTYASIIQTIQARGYVRLGPEAVPARGRRGGGDGQADPALPRRRRRQLHRPDGGGAGRDRGGQRHPRGRPAGFLRPVRGGAGAGRGEVRAVPGGDRGALSEVSDRGAGARAPTGAARPVRQVHRLRELPRLRLHQEPRRERTSRAGAAGRDVPRVRAPAREEGGAVRTVHRMQRLPGLSLHQEGAAEEHGRHLSAVRAGRAGREADAVRADVRVRSLSGLRLRDEQPTGEGHPLPGLWWLAPPSPEEPSVLALRG